MPIYQFKNTETGEEFEDMISISSKDNLLEMNPHIQQVPTGFTVVTGVGDNRQKGVPNGFKDVLSKIGEKYQGSPLADEYVKKSVKEAKVDQIKQKWIDKGVKDASDKANKSIKWKNT